VTPFQRGFSAQSVFVASIIGPLPQQVVGNPATLRLPVGAQQHAIWPISLLQKQGFT
jgi:hypothetical protein